MFARFIRQNKSQILRNENRIYFATILERDNYKQKYNKIF